MSDIAKLTVALYANSAQFVSELDRSQKKAKTWSSKVSGGFNIAAKTVAAASAAAAGSLMLLYNQQAEWIDQTAKHADTLGITTEALTQFRHAAELTGVGSKNLDTSLQRMTRRIAEAAAGTGEAKDALDELGISAQQLNTVTPEEQMYVLADAFAQVENQSDRVRYAFKLFDSEGVKMANMLAGGSSSLRDMANEADALGITLTRVDAAKIEMANDAMYKVSASTQAWSKSIAVELAPLLAAMSDEITNATKAAGGFGVVTSEVFDGVVKGAAFAADVWRGWELIIKSTEAAAQGYKLAMMSVWQTVIDGAVNAGEAIVKSVVWPMQAALDALAPYSDQAAELAASLDKLTSFKAPQLFNLADAKLDYSQALWELRDLASQPLPSEGIEAWYDNAKKRIQDAAELYAANINRNNGQYPPSGSGGDGAKEDQSLASFREATNQLETEYHRRLAIQAAGEQAAATQEAFAYADRQAQLSEQFQAAYDAAVDNQTLQQELEDQYFASRELLWQDHQNRLTGIEKEAADKRMAYQQQVASDLLTFTQQQMSITTGVLRDAGMESSGLYKALFAMQKAAAIPSMIVATEEAALKAMAAFPGPAGVTMAGAVRAMGYASVGMVGTQAIMGMAHDGISEIPSEGTWLLNKGERVYTNESANKLDDMYTHIKGQGVNQKDQQPKVRITINEAPPGTHAETRWSDEELIVNVMMKDANQSGRYMSYISQKLGVRSGGYK
jgi:glycine cleavage system H lipoate-binding protein